MAGDYIARVLDPKVPFERRFGQISGLCDDPKPPADRDDGSNRWQIHHDSRNGPHSGRRNDGSAETRPGFVRADPRRQFRPADAATRDISAGIRGDHQCDNPEDLLQTDGGVIAQPDERDARDEDIDQAEPVPRDRARATCRDLAPLDDHDDGEQPHKQHPSHTARVHRGHDNGNEHRCGDDPQRQRFFRPMDGGVSRRRHSAASDRGIPGWRR